MSEDKKNMEAVENTEVEKVEPNIYIRYKAAILEITTKEKVYASLGCAYFDHNVFEYATGNTTTFYGPEELKETVPWKEIAVELSRIGSYARTDMQTAFGLSFPHGA